MQAAKKLITSIKEKGATSEEEPLSKGVEVTKIEKGGQWGSGGLRVDKLADLSWLVRQWGECSR